MSSDAIVSSRTVKAAVIALTAVRADGKSMTIERQTSDGIFQRRAAHSAIAFCVAVAGLLGSPSKADAAGPPPWPSGPYRYITVDQSVSDALIELGRNIGIPVRVSEEVKGRLSPGMPVGTAQEFLEWVCNRYGLVWHYDGSVLNIAAEAEIQTEIVKLDANTAESASDRLAKLGVSDPRFPIKISATDNVVSISGPPSYVALVKKTLGVPSEKPVAQDGAIPVRVFRGRSAETQNFPAAKPPSQ